MMYHWTPSLMKLVKKKPRPYQSLSRSWLILDLFHHSNHSSEMQLKRQQGWLMGVINILTMHKKFMWNWAQSLCPNDSKSHQEEERYKAHFLQEGWDVGLLNITNGCQLSSIMPWEFHSSPINDHVTNPACPETHVRALQKCCCRALANTRLLQHQWQDGK